jgi:rsbT co-antagonist protein RsbR
LDRHQLIATLQERLPSISLVLADRLVEAQLDTYMGVPREQLSKMTAAAVSGLLTDIDNGRAEAFPAYWASNTGTRAEQGAKVEDMIQAITIGLELLSADVAELVPDDLELQNWWLSRSAPLAFSGLITLAQIFTVVRERTIRIQEARIRELSSPIIPLYNGILVLPLVGAIDSHRAGQIMESLLSGISDQQADVVIMDITGVPVVDTSVANYLLLAARAARLLGAQIILVGISAEVAQTITQLGADLSSIITRANLQSGIEYALGVLGLAIAPQA